MPTIRNQRPTPQAVAQSLELMRRLCEPTPREKAEQRIRRAKADMTRAAQAVLDRDPEAPEMAERAMASLRTAQEEIERLDADEDSR